MDTRFNIHQSELQTNYFQKEALIDGYFKLLNFQWKLPGEIKGQELTLY